VTRAMPENPQFPVCSKGPRANTPPSEPRGRGLHQRRGSSWGSPTPLPTAMPQTFEFKPAPFARPVQVEVDAQGAILRSAKGAVKARVEFSAAQRLRFAEMRGRGTATRWFDVEHGAGRFRLGCNSAEADDPTKGHLGQYRAAVRAILLGVEARTPGLEVELDAGKGMRITMFTIGLFTGAFGLLVPLSAIFGGIEKDRVWGAMLPSLVMLGMGLFLTTRYKPWVPGVRAPAAALAEALGSAGEATR